MGEAGNFARLNRLLARAAARGEPMAEALEEASETLDTRRLRDSCDEASRAMRDGASLSRALAARFPSDYVAMVDAGERGGTLSGVLEAAADEAEMQARVARGAGRVRAYLLFGFGVLALVMMLIAAAARQFALLYLQLGVRFEEPYATLLRVARNGWMTSGGILAFIVVAIVLWKLLAGAVARSRVAYWLPLVDGIVRMRDLSAACAVVGLRLQAGAALPDALQDASRAVRNRRFRAELRRVQGRVAEGASLSEALFYVSFFPRTLAWAVSLGEQRADVPGVLRSFGTLYHAQLARLYDVLLVLLTPLAVLALANVVFVALLSLFGPLIAIQKALVG